MSNSISEIQKFVQDTLNSLLGSLNDGFADYLSKPFNREQIKQKLDVIFESSNKINLDKWKGVPMHVFGKED